MNPREYRALDAYLRRGKLPKESNQKLRISRLAKDCEIKSDGTIWRHHQQIPKEEEKNEILKKSHDHPTAAHRGIHTTLSRIKQHYYWPKMRQDVQQWIKTCDRCQKHQQKQRPQQKLQPLPTTQPFEVIGVDIIGPLPVTKRGKRYILTIIDHFTKWTEAFALEIADALSIYGTIYDEWICRYGKPAKIISDRGTEFINKLSAIFGEKLGIQQIRTSAYHPQANGLTERTNQTIKRSLAKVSTEEDWDIYLPAVLFAIRKAPSQTTKYSPYQLTFGITARTPEAPPDAPRIVENLKEIRRCAQDYIKKAQDRQKRNFDKIVTNKVDLQIGDTVLLYRNTIEGNWSAKLEPKWEGPYTIHRTHRNSTYSIKTQQGVILKTPVHRNRLRKYYPRDD
jgi:transposase InsO family protein